jgi:hypothetical protein
VTLRSLAGLGATATGCGPVAAVSGTLLVKLFAGNQLGTFLVPCGIGGFPMSTAICGASDVRAGGSETTSTVDLAVPLAIATPLLLTWMPSVARCLFEA